MLNCFHTLPVSPFGSTHFTSGSTHFFTSMLNCFHTLPVSPFRSTHFISRFHPFTMLDYFHTLPVSPLKAKGCGFNTQVPPSLLLCLIASKFYQFHHLDLLTASPGSTHFASMLNYLQRLSQLGSNHPISKLHPLERSLPLNSTHLTPYSVTPCPQHLHPPDCQLCPLEHPHHPSPECPHTISTITLTTTRMPPQ